MTKRKARNAAQIADPCKSSESFTPPRYEAVCGVQRCI